MKAWFLVAALLLVLVGGRYADTGSYVAADAVLLGYTECVNGRPVAWVSSDIWDNPRLEAAVKTHERKHMDQVRRFRHKTVFWRSDCKAWVNWHRANPVAVEAEAFAAQVNAGLTSLPHAARWLATGYPHFELTEPQALVVISLYVEK